MENREFLIPFLSLVIATLLLVTVRAEPETGTTKGNGFGEDYDWVQLEDGFRVAQETNRPLMLLLYKPWCGACQALKPQFAQSGLIKDLSQHFVMVNSDDDGDSDKELFQPDGGYIPRILFFDSNGTLLRDVVNEGGSPDYKYYYHEDESISKSMRAVLRRDEQEAEAEPKTANKTEL